MKQNRLTKIVSALLALLMVCLSYVPVFADQAIVTVIDFLSDFNYYASLIETNCELKIGDFDVVSDGNGGMLMKAVYHDCVIMSIRTDNDLEDVFKVTCTIAALTKASSAYVGDFTDMIALSMMACGMSTSSVNSALSDIQSHGIGAAGTFDGLTFTFEEAVARHLSFSIVRE